MSAPALCSGVNSGAGAAPEGLCGIPAPPAGLRAAPRTFPGPGKVRGHQRPAPQRRVQQPPLLRSVRLVKGAANSNRIVQFLRRIFTKIIINKHFQERGLFFFLKFLDKQPTCRDKALNFKVL